MPPMIPPDHTGEHDTVCPCCPSGVYICWLLAQPAKTSSNGRYLMGPLPVHGRYTEGTHIDARWDPKEKCGYLANTAAWPWLPGAPGPGGAGVWTGPHF